MLSHAWRWLREVSGIAQSQRNIAAVRDPWRRYDLEPPLRAFGPGAADFRGYLAGSCRVACDSPKAIGDWLLGCRYADDAQLLGEADHWLHPATFELLRCGDCEDFSLWAWRQLIEARYAATFVVGMRSGPGTARGRHAWVTYLDGSVDYLFDGVERSIARMIRPCSGVQALYEPQLGVDADGARFVFAGLYREPWARQLRLRPGSAPRR